MKNLKCTTSNCEFNVRNHCNAKIVDITEKGVCSTRIKRKGGAYAQAIAEFELSDELFPSTPLDTAVMCNAKKCAYNNGHACTRDSLLVGDSIIKTKCFSMKKPNTEKDKN